MIIRPCREHLACCGRLRDMAAAANSVTGARGRGYNMAGSDVVPAVGYSMAGSDVVPAVGYNMAGSDVVPAAGYIVTWLLLQTP